MPALGVTWMCDWVYMWNWLCVFVWIVGYRRQHSGGGQGVLVLLEMFPWVMLAHVGGLQERGRRSERWEKAMEEKEVEIQSQAWGKLNKTQIAVKSCQLHRLTSGLCKTSLHWNEAGVSAVFTPRRRKLAIEEFLNLPQELKKKIKQC